MRIDFFEEFPTEANLSKAKLIRFDSTVYIAAKNLAEFRKHAMVLRRYNKKMEAAWWPVLPRSYWVSPFSYTAELEKLSLELQKNRKTGKKLKVLLDLELPMLKKKLVAKNMLRFFRNKKLIRGMFSDAFRNRIDILTAEYPVSNRLLQKKLEMLGVSYNVKRYPHKKIVMFYTSMLRSRVLVNAVKRYIARRAKKLGGRFQVGVGTIAVGVLGNEPILPASGLERDLRFLRSCGVKTVVVFRLGGMKKEYVDVLKKHA